MDSRSDGNCRQDVRPDLPDDLLDSLKAPLDALRPGKRFFGCLVSTRAELHHPLFHEPLDLEPTDDVA